MARFVLRQQFLIQGGEDFHRPHVGDGDVTGIVRTSIGEGDHAGTGKRKRSASAGAGSGSKMIGDFLESAVGGIETDLGVALIIVTEEDAAVVTGPLRVLD